MSDGVQESRVRKLIVSSTSSVTRMANDRRTVNVGLKDSKVEDRLEQVMRPKSVSGGMKKLGIALVAAPDPISGVPGVALLATSYAMKKREPAGLTQLAKETRKVLHDIDSLRI